MAGAWFGTWKCNCTTVELRRHDVLLKCPTHGEHLLAPAEQIDEIPPTGLGLRDANDDRP